MMTVLPMAIDQNTLAGDSIWVTIIKAVLILVFLLTSVLFAVWFERRVIGRLQERPGPNRHGPFGLFQSVMDAMKLLMKEDITVRASEKLIYIAAPMISVFAALLIFAVIPFGPETRIPFTDEVTPLQLTDFPVAVLYILACAALGVYGIVLGGWASGSTYPLMGAVRSTAQVISYELAMGLSLVTVFMFSGAMSTQEIVAAQEDVWWALPLLPAFVIYLISMVGETNRLPFDLPEAEGELVAGFMTEYSSMKFAWFFLAEYMNMINVSAVAATLFLGGWRPLWWHEWPGYYMLSNGIFPPLWLIIKIWLLMFLFVWIRGSVLRFRYEQFMRFGWKVLIPVALSWVVLSGVGMVLLPHFNRNTSYFVMFAPIIALLLAWVVFSLVADSKAMKREEQEAARREKFETDEFDAFAGGYPVPPLPGQKLPPSPRSGRTVDAVKEAQGD
ncbi:NADH-quinone oxidoreductase subunit NuoH [Demequina sp. TTPB684]|nr:MULTISPECIES: NADH-quinone oxidoreductase subunit NuoH [unclassified Demequina]MCB2411797.1 NADH-quinone oxidoreductase subunit NuoH [Demequina sp. TTPB684]UPU88312.1 NADH-quinone oxidoreductase subunit NuoH [Demequina sp. TMPB413]